MAIRLDVKADELRRTTGLPPIASFTAMGWFQLVVNRATSTSFLAYGQSATGSPWYYYQLSTKTDGLTVQWWSGIGPWYGQVLTVGQWYHMTMVVSGTGAGQAQGFVNAVLDVTGDGFASVPSQLIVVGGDADSPDHCLNGRVAAVQIWGAALTQAEIAQEMRQYLPVRFANLNAFCPLLTAGNYQDYSTNGNHLTNSGGTLQTEDGPPIPWRLAPPRFRRRRIVVVTKAPPPRLSRWRPVRRTAYA